MLMTSMIGVDQEGLENSVKVDGKIMKHEPMYVSGNRNEILKTYNNLYSQP